jgi:hypothetical protein
MRDILEGGQRRDGGQASLAFNLIMLLDSPIVHRWSGDGDEYVDDFKVRDFITDKPKNEQGGFHSTLQTARRNAILSQVFGYGEEAFDNSAVKTALDKALPSAIVLQYYYETDKGKMPLRLAYLPGDVEGRKRVITGIPAGDMFDLLTVDGEGKETLTATGKRALSKSDESFLELKGRLPKDDAERRAFMLTRPLATSGALHPTYGAKTLTAVQFLDALKARGEVDGVLPPPAPRNTKGKVDAGLDIGRSVKLLTDWVAIISAPDGEVDVAPNDEREAALDRLCEAWAAYRVANPRGDLQF